MTINEMQEHSDKDKLFQQVITAKSSAILWNSGAFNRKHYKFLIVSIKTVQIPKPY